MCVANKGKLRRGSHYLGCCMHGCHKTWSCLNSAFFFCLSCVLIKSKCLVLLSFILSCLILSMPLKLRLKKNIVFIYLFKVFQYRPSIMWTAFIIALTKCVIRSFSINLLHFGMFGSFGSPIWPMNFLCIRTGFVQLCILRRVLVAFQTSSHPLYKILCLKVKGLTLNTKSIWL